MLLEGKTRHNSVLSCSSDAATETGKSALLKEMQNMGRSDRIVRSIVGLILVYISIMHKDIIGNNMLNALVGMFGAMNCVSSLLKICPAYLLTNFSTAPGNGCQPDSNSSSALAGIEDTDFSQGAMLQTEKASILRRKLQLSIILPMVALLVLFGTIVFDLDHRLTLAKITKQSDVAAFIASNSTLHALSDSNSSAALSHSNRTWTSFDQAAEDITMLLLHDSAGNSIASDFNRGLENEVILAQLRKRLSETLPSHDSRGMLTAGGAHYVWSTAQIGDSETWVTTIVPSPQDHTTIKHLLSTQILIVALAVTWLAVWTSSYIVRKFLSRIHDNAALLHYRATHDALTGLPNRLKIDEIIDECARNLNPRNERIVLLLVDIIEFRDINDTLGYSLGDQLLTEIGAHLNAIDPGNIHVVRMGADVFSLVCVTDHDTTNCSRQANAVHDSLEKIVELNGLPMSINARIGMSSFPTDSTESEELIRFADIALAQAKSQRLKNNFYQFELDTHSIRKLTLLARLRSVIEQNELTLVYQPKIDIYKDTVVGVEVLARWTDPEYGSVSPIEFITWAEKSGLIDKLTRCILRAAAAQMNEWKNLGFDIPLAVNLSPTNLYDAKLIPLISELVNEGSFADGRLELEITENAVMEDPESALLTMNVLKRLGVSFAIDDFGTGLSSFTYLRKFPVSNLKIDRAFVSRDEENDKDAVLLQSMIELGHSLGCVVTAEGVEDQMTLDNLRKYQCDYVQGYFTCRPLPASEFIDWLGRNEQFSASVAA